MTIEIGQFGPAAAERLFRLRQKSLADEPFAFLSSPDDDLVQSPEVMSERLASLASGLAIFGTFDGDELVGMAGVSRDRHIKAAHRACVWGFEPDCIRHDGESAREYHLFL